MGKNLITSFIKLIAFAAFILLVVTAVRFASVYKDGNKDLFSRFYISSTQTKKHVYFIGTSRTRHAVNDSMLNALMPRAHFVNAGMGYGTLNSTVIIANKIMERVPSSILFIELSVANGRMPNYFSLMANPGTTLPVLKSWAQEASFNELQKMHIPFTENYLYDYIYLKPHLKLIAGKATTEDFLGRLKRYESMQYDIGTFLSSRDLNNVHLSCNEIPGIYPQMIGQLLQKAAATNSEVIFYLPVCINADTEKNRLLCVYNSLPEKNKMHYSASFLSEISKPELIVDGTHFNVKGADVYTSYLFDFIKNRFGLQDETSKRTKY